MRHALWLLVIGCGLMMTADSQAQQPLTLGGINPTQIINQPIDTSSAIIRMPNLAPRKTSFRLLDFLPKFNFPVGRTLIGGSIFPSTTPGPEHLKAFNIRRGGIFGFGQ